MLHNLDTLDLSVLQTIQTISYEDHDLDEIAQATRPAPGRWRSGRAQRRLLVRAE